MAVKLTARDITSDSAELYLSGLPKHDSAEREVWFWITIGGMDNYVGKVSLRASATSASIDVDGLTPHTKYPISAEVVFSISGYSDWYEGSFTTLDEKETVALWDWNIKNVNASASLTMQAYSAILYGGATTNFSYAVWNDLVDKTKEVYDALGWSFITIISGYNSFSSIKANSGSYITAAIYNSLFGNLHMSLYGYYDSSVTQWAYPGKKIKGDDFVWIGFLINELIYKHDLN